MKTEILTGAAIQHVLPELARLRIQVFRSWPYLYDGSLEYEQDYLRKFAQTNQAVMVAAWDEAGNMVGASTASPLLGHADEFAAPFTRAGIPAEHVFYFGESVLLPAYRGKGVGRAFFDGREAMAKQFGYTKAAFCAVVRQNDDPRTPSDYRPLDEFWQRRGFAKAKDLVANLEWKEVGQKTPSTHSLQFWLKTLN